MPQPGYPLASTPPGGGVLDGPPPSPGAESGMSPGMNLGQVAGYVPTDQMPPEILTGIMKSGQTMVSMLDSFAQAVPELAPDFAAAKTQLQIALAKVLQAGAGPASPQGTGSNFPGGGFDQGAIPLAPER